MMVMIQGGRNMSQDKIDMDRIKRIQDMDFTSEETRQEIYNIIEMLCAKIIELEQRNQELKDENMRLKGEKGKPDIKANTKPEEKIAKKKMEKGEKKEWKKGTKKDNIKIDREEIKKLDKTNLPKDIIFKGYEERIIQNIIIQTDNVLYKLEKYYSPSEHKTYIAKMDENLRDTEFGAETKGLISTLYYENRVTENKIATLLNTNGLQISEGTISNILIKEKSKELTAEKEEIFRAGLQSSIYQHIDDTGMRIAGRNGYATIICNDNYSAFFINDKKNRETVKKMIDEEARGLFTVLVCDDAPQFKTVAHLLSLCWIHEDRHYEKLMPVLECHKEELKRVRGEFWEYYGQLKEYKENPTEEKKVELSKSFDEVFCQRTGYEDLDKRLNLTYAKKDYLLVVLDYPEVPLHNNLSENGIREMVIKRKISGGVETEEGKKALENNMTILGTCKKLGISFYNYMKNIFAGIGQPVRLSELISKK
jgi:hypothetical protein